MSSNTSLQNMALLLAALDHGPSRKGLSADQIAGIDDCIIVSLDFEAWERAPRPVTEFGVLCTPLTPPSPLLASSPRYRKIIRADHASGNEDKYLSKLGCSDDVLGTVIGAIDTQVLARARGFGVTTLPQIGLGPLLEIFGVHPAHWHNSGNDAAYTLFATLMMALKAASRGDVLPHHDLLAMGTRLLVKVDALGTGMKLLVPKRTPVVAAASSNVQARRLGVDVEVEVGVEGVVNGS
ncbi:hypothetical protein H2199_000872 [Coniosporium tulheliwenetii]|uniref:Uncharacterized protein n=1 Tax=Coniosporium tulheliwenetii TaxID=3383036 RepID=A0ACC2ZN63_9PEZI|nr:hypothetical protein H2199_000872 [Cladosporium sp. JES 115]